MSIQHHVCLTKWELITVPDGLMLISMFVPISYIIYNKCLKLMFTRDIASICRQSVNLINEKNESNFVHACICMCVLTAAHMGVCALRL
jgi:hypothetical protein